MKETITLQLDIFEGPFELLLYLIKKNDLEISRVSLAQVTDQYLQYLDALKDINVDLASDFLYMAAELALIKSRMLLPNESAQLEDEEDATAYDLIAKLKELEQYKLAAQDLKGRVWLNRDVFTRGSFLEETDEAQDAAGKKADHFDVDPMDLIKVFSDLLTKLPKEKRDHHVLIDRVSVADRIYEILESLKDADSVLFTDLFTREKTRMAIVVTFLAILEMARLRMIRIYQMSHFEAIRVQRKMEIGSQVMDNNDMLKDIESYR